MRHTAGRVKHKHDISIFLNKLAYQKKAYSIERKFKETRLTNSV